MDRTTRSLNITLNDWSMVCCRLKASDFSPGRQLMLGKFTGNTTSWLDMKARLEGHQYWISELFSTLPSGHALAQPLLLMMQARSDVANGLMTKFCTSEPL